MDDIYTSAMTCVAIRDLPPSSPPSCTNMSNDLGSRFRPLHLARMWTPAHRAALTRRPLSRTLSRHLSTTSPGLLLRSSLSLRCTTCDRPVWATRQQTAPHSFVYAFRRSLHSSRVSSDTLPRQGPVSRSVPLSRSSRRLRRLRNTLVLLALLTVLYYTVDPFRYTVIAGVRCARLMRAVVLDVWDYKQTFAREERLSDSDEDRAIKRAARKECHLRSAKRMLDALKKNSGIYVKLGQHVAAVQVLPKEWTSTMTPLQDQCFPSPVEDIDDMLREDLGMGIDDLFTEFEADPIGVASLAQVHRAIDKRTGRHVAVKVQHADLQDFAKIDMATTNFAIHLVKYIFPDFEFSWLAGEMNEMLPLEMDFRHEAYNSARCRSDFSHLKGKTSLYLPEVMWAERRCMVMEYIEGARVDDLAYLMRHKIDRNQVSQELSRIFSQMVYINGYFHADPHHGNLLIRPRTRGSSSPFNFDICLLDHGQYFDIPDELRVNYARFWLSLIKRSSPATSAERRKYARLVGNIDDEMVSRLAGARMLLTAVPHPGIGDHGSHWSRRRHCGQWRP